MVLLDYLVITLVLLIVLLIGFGFAKKAGKSTDEFILGGRKMPWWLGGISILATNLNASTMLLETRKIRQDGIAGMWYTWNHVIGGLIGSIWLSRLWRRARYTTPMDFYLSRYSGWQAHFGRTFDVILFAIVLSCVWSAVGLVGMKKVIHALIGLPETFQMFGISVASDWFIVILLAFVTLAYTATGGVHAVVWTDLIEFGVAMGVSYTLLFLVYRDVGWAPGLQKGIEGFGAESSKLLRWLPVLGPIFIYYIFISPFAGMGNVGPSVQRFLCIKDEREVLYTSLLSVVGTYLIKSWPFYILGLCGVIVVADSDLLARFPAIYTPEGNPVADYEMLLPLLTERYLPPGMVGLMMAAFMCAFMSSFSSNIHNSSANFIHDVLQAYVIPGRSEKTYIRYGRVFTFVLTVVICIVAASVTDILKLSMFAASILVSAGFVKLLRFIWWRINGWAEVSAQIVSVFSAAFFLSPIGNAFLLKVMETVGLAGNDGFFVVRQIAMQSLGTFVAVGMALCTKHESMEKLGEFYRVMRPFGFWGPVREACGLRDLKPDPYHLLVLLTVSTNVMFFGALFGIFAMFLAYWAAGTGMFALSGIGIFATWWSIKKLYPNGGDPDGLEEGSGLETQADSPKRSPVHS